MTVLVHPGCHPRFAFVASARISFRSGYDVPDEVFMALELVQNCPKGASGKARYHEVFAAAG